MITNDLDMSEYGHDHLQKKKDAAMTVTENRMLPCDITGLFLEGGGFPKNQ